MFCNRIRLLIELLRKIPGPSAAIQEDHSGAQLGGGFGGLVNIERQRMTVDGLVDHRAADRACLEGILWV